MRLIVFGEEERVAHIYGEVFVRLGVVPTYLNPDVVSGIGDIDCDVILVSLEWVPSWRSLIAQARRAGIPVVYVMDGVLEWSYVWENDSYIKPNGTMLQPLLASVLCVIGRHPARILASLGLAKSIRIVGLPRFDRINPYRVIKPHTKPIIVVATARTYGHNIAQRLSVIEALGDLATYFSGIPDIDVIWRIDPSLAEHVGVVASVDGGICDVLSHATGLISFSSTVLLEGMTYGLPTAQIEYRAVPVYVKTAWEIRSARQISTVVQELLYPPAEKLAYQDSCLEDELEAGDSSVRLANVIRDAIQHETGHKSQEQTEFVYPRLDFRQIHSNISVFSRTPMSLLQYELDGAYLQIEQLRQHLAECNMALRNLRVRKSLLHRLSRLFRS